MLNAGRMIEHLVIPEAQDDKVARAQPGIALGIVGALGMLAAVELDDELPLEADEVHDVASELLLPAELEAAEAAVAQQAPHPPLGFRRLAPHLARPVLQEVFDHRSIPGLGGVTLTRSASPTRPPPSRGR